MKRIFFIEFRPIRSSTLLWPNSSLIGRRWLELERACFDCKAHWQQFDGRIKGHQIPPMSFTKMRLIIFTVQTAENQAPNVKRVFHFLSLAQTHTLSKITSTHILKLTLFVSTNNQVLTHSPNHFNFTLSLTHIRTHTDIHTHIKATMALRFMSKRQPQKYDLSYNLLCLLV